MRAAGAWLVLVACASEALAAVCPRARPWPLAELPSLQPHLAVMTQERCHAFKYDHRR